MNLNIKQLYCNPGFHKPHKPNFQIISLN